MRGDDTVTETYPHPRRLPTSLLAAASAAAAAAAVTASHRGEREPKIAAVLPPHLSLSLPLFFTLFVDDGILIMWKVRRGRRRGGGEGSFCFVFLCIVYKKGPVSVCHFVFCLSLLKSVRVSRGFPHALQPPSQLRHYSQWK